MHWVLSTTMEMAMGIHRLLQLWMVVVVGGGWGGHTAVPPAGDGTDEVTPVVPHHLERAVEMKRWSPTHTGGDTAVPITHKWGGGVKVTPMVPTRRGGDDTVVPKDGGGLRVTQRSPSPANGSRGTTLGSPISSCGGATVVPTDGSGLQEGTLCSASPVGEGRCSQHTEVLRR